MSWDDLGAQEELSDPGTDKAPASAHGLWCPWGW